MTNLDHDTAKEILEGLIDAALRKNEILMRENALASWDRASLQAFRRQLNDLLDNWDVVPVEPDEGAGLKSSGTVVMDPNVYHNIFAIEARLEQRIRELEASYKDMSDEIFAMMDNLGGLTVRIEELAKVVNAHAASIKTTQQSVQLHDSELGDLEYRVDKLERP